MDLRLQKQTIFEGFLFFLLISFSLHFAFVLLLFFQRVKVPEIEQIEVQVLDDSSRKKGQVVEQDKKAVNDEIDEKTKFLSAHNQKVIRQTVAKKSGEFKNRSSENDVKGKHLEISQLKPQFDISKAIKQMQEREKILLENSDVVIAKNKPQQSSPSRAQEASQTVDYIKELDPGLETMLSTREFVYYTYYARVRQQLSQYWAPKIREKMVKLNREGRQIASTEDKITRCLVTLDKLGKLMRVQIIGISGIREIDEAAVESFKLAAPFPNPPNGIIEADGTIKIRWDFILEM
jgi:TonB family protein